MKKNRVFKFILILFLFFNFLILSGCSIKKEKLSDLDIIKQRGYIIIGVKSDSPPFGYYDKDNKLVGLDIEISKKIAQYVFDDSSPDKYKLVTVSPQNRISKLNSKEVDVLVATMSVNDKRKLVIDFSSPYYMINQKIMVKKNSKINNIQYFNKNGKLVVVMGTTGDKIVRMILPNAYVIGAKTYNEAINYLKNNQVDAILGDDAILNGLNNGEYKIINRSYSREFYAVAVRKSADSKELLNKINSVIATILDEKKINFVNKVTILD